MMQVQESRSRPRGVTAALGANVLGVTHDRESFMPLTPDIVEIVRKTCSVVQFLSFLLIEMISHVNFDA